MIRTARGKLGAAASDDDTLALMCGGAVNGVRIDGWESNLTVTVANRNDDAAAPVYKTLTQLPVGEVVSMAIFLQERGREGVIRGGEPL